MFEGPNAETHLGGFSGRPLVKIVYAPSGKRMLPYPPVAPFMLAASVSASGGRAPEVVDLEILLSSMYEHGQASLLYTDGLLPADALAPITSTAVEEYGDLLARLVGLDGENVAISVMGYPQLASALLLARIALQSGSQVILGGQFWSEESALHALDALAPFGEATITVGDGWDAIAGFATNQREVPPNSYGMRYGEISAGPRTGRAVPPQPDYSRAQWDLYGQYASKVYHRSDTDTRRCHLYIWDKICNFRCAFCRVASGSKATLTPPTQALASIEHLLSEHVTQMNFMTNELNPSRTYMLRFLDGLEELLGRSGRLDDASVHWLSYVRADALEPDDMRKFRRVGGRFARYGVESGSQRLLDLMRKDYAVTTIERTLSYAAQADVWNHINLLVGFPGEKDSDVDASCAFLERNANMIHSVRINPFYLPPDTPIARTPEEFGVTLTRFNKGWWEYEFADGSPPSPDAVVDNINRISQTCVDLDISFAGNDPFLLLDILGHHDSREDARNELRERFPFFWEARPPAYYQAMVGGYEATVSPAWRDTALKRGENYSLAFCTD